MRNAIEENVRACPECGAEVRTDRRFTAWCAACDWNVDPGGPEKEAGRPEELRQASARRHGERLSAEVAAGGTPTSGWDRAGVLAYVMALAVHGVTVALAVGGILLVVLGWGTLLPALGAISLVLGCALRPRFGRLPDGPVLYRADAPQLFALIDEVAVVAGTTGVHAVAVTPDVNASVTTYGWRQRRLLTIGLGLWEYATPQQRIALLGHELGHYANGNVRYGLVVGSAVRSLTEWLYMVQPESKSPVFYGGRLVGYFRAQRVPSVVLNVFYLPARSAVQGLLTLLDRLSSRAAQRGEYLADAIAARAGSTEAAVGLIDCLLVTGSAETLLLREANAARTVRRGGRAAKPGVDPRGLWERLAAHMASIPEHEYERQRRAGALRGHSVDATHPPTHLRRACLLARPAAPAAVTVDDARQTAIAVELAPAQEQLARQILARS
ncbi:M48 family metalloprotease [Streptomyces sp. NPDC049577]|uniref:M48 family metalloprotease n=1 Tax=Streptomyces sp. NPDC049577 TaxID=3155153 RepID=UPI003432CB63